MTPSRTLYRTGLLSIALITAAAACAADAPEIPYEGTRLARTIHVDKLRTLFTSVDSLARDRAERRTGLPLDAGRLRLVLEDVPVGKSLQTTVMLTEGADTTTVRIRAQVWLRTAHYDSVAALETLTHEYVHAILFQQLPPSDCTRLPEWFHEGLAVHLAGQSDARLHVALAREWQAHDALYEGLADGPADDDNLAGAWWFEALEALRGPGATRDLLAALVETRTLYGALAAVDCKIEELWREAEASASARIEELTRDVQVRLVVCMAKKMTDPEQGLVEFRKLAEDHPDTYAGQFALYWAAYLSVQQNRVAHARDFLDRLDLCPHDFGLGDGIMYLRVVIEWDCGHTARARRLCEDYFGLWPDGYFYDQVQQIYRSL